MQVFHQTDAVKITIVMLLTKVKVRFITGPPNLTYTEKAAIVTYATILVCQKITHCDTFIHYGSVLSKVIAQRGCTLVVAGLLMSSKVKPDEIASRLQLAIQQCIAMRYQSRY